jgi:hypothetical protein
MNYQNPEWDKAERVHDWRNHVSIRVQALWQTFNDEQKLALYEQAEACSSAEEWD